MSTASSGRRREHRVRDELAARGWIPVMRSAASKGPADLFLVHPDRGGALVQVGGISKRLDPEPRDLFVHVCELSGMLPILAIAPPRQPTVYWQVTRDTASKWTPWTP